MDSRLDSARIEDDRIQRSRRRTGRNHWTTDVCELASKHGCKNVYVDLGTTFATVAVTAPMRATGAIGQFIHHMGPEKVVWGTDSVWYGSPQWQIEAFCRLEVPKDMMKRFGWKLKLGAADGKVKNMIFGQNSARLYRYKIQSEYEQLTTDKLTLMKQHYEAEGVERNNTAYGYVGTKAG